MFRAIGLACPYLKDVSFDEKKKGNLDSDVHQQLELALTKWPKVI